jgi:predicted RND superfamily exporter protein
MIDEAPLRTRYLRRFTIGVGLLVLLAIPAIVHSQAAIESLYNHPSEWVPDSIREKAEFNEFAEHFAVSNLLMIAWEGSDLDSPSLQQVTAALRLLSQADFGSSSDETAVAEFSPRIVEQIADMRTVAGTATPFRFVHNGDETLARLTAPPVNLSRRAAISRLTDTLIGADGAQTCIVLSFDEQSSRLRRQLIPKLRQLVAEIVGIAPSEIVLVGTPLEGAMVDLESIQSIRRYSPPSAILAAVLCLLCLRSGWLTGAVVAIAVIGEGLVLAAVYYVGVPMNAVLIVLPPLVFVLTVSAGIHLSNYFLDAADQFPELSLPHAAQRAMKAGVMPCVLAAGTTVVGFSSLLLVRLEPVRVFGGIASAGVILTLALLFLLLPGAMVLSRPRRGTETGAGAGAGAGADLLRDDRLGWAKRKIRKRLNRPFPTIATFLIIAGTLSFGLTRLESTVNIPRMFLPESDLRTQYDWFEQHLGPTSTGDLLLRFPLLTDDDDPLERLTVVARVHRQLLEQNVVAGAMSAMTFVPAIPRGQSLGATAQRGAIRKLIRDPDSSLGRLGFISHTDHEELWRINVRIPQHQRADFGADIAAIRTAVAAQLSDLEPVVRFTLTGSVVIVQRSQEILLEDLFRSFMTAFVAIAVVMMLMLRSVIGGLLAMAPNVFPTVALFGFMGLIATPLDIGSVMSASVALGIAVDDTVHLLSRFGARRARGLSQFHAAIGALRQCGWAMFQTTFVCGVSLMVYYFSPFVPTSRFSLFMFSMLSIALLGVLVLLPALMVSPLGHWLAHTVGSDATPPVHSDQPTAERPSDIRRLPTRYQTTRW